MPLLDLLSSSEATNLLANKSENKLDIPLESSFIKAVLIELKEELVFPDRIVLKFPYLPSASSQMKFSFMFSDVFALYQK